MTRTRPVARKMLLSVWIAVALALGTAWTVQSDSAAAGVPHASSPLANTRASALDPWVEFAYPIPHFTRLLAVYRRGTTAVIAYGLDHQPWSESVRCDVRVRIYKRSQLKRTMWVHGWSNRDSGTNRVRILCNYRRGTYNVRMRAFYFPEEIQSHTARLYFRIK